MAAYPRHQCRCKSRMALRFASSPAAAAHLSIVVHAVFALMSSGPPAFFISTSFARNFSVTAMCTGVSYAFSVLTNTVRAASNIRGFAMGSKTPGSVSFGDRTIASQVATSTWQMVLLPVRNPREQTMLDGQTAPETGFTGKMSFSRCASFFAAASASFAFCASSSSGVRSSGRPSFRRRSLLSSSAPPARRFGVLVWDMGRGGSLA